MLIVLTVAIPKPNGRFRGSGLGRLGTKGGTSHGAAPWEQGGAQCIVYAIGQRYVLLCFVSYGDVSLILASGLISRYEAMPHVASECGGAAKLVHVSYA